MHPDVATALRLQALDLRAGELRREIASLPKQIAEIEKALDSHINRLDLDKAALAANGRERMKLDADILGQQQKISKLRGQMMEAKTNEQYRAFQQEIGYLDQAIRKSEDRLLDLMGEAETLEANVKKAEVALLLEKKSVDAEKSLAKQRSGVDRDELKRIEAERASIAATLTPAILSAYERLRTRIHPDGQVTAEARDGMCLGCMMTMRPQLFQEVKTGEQVVFCESCRRILYCDEPPRDVEAAMNA